MGYVPEADLLPLYVNANPGNVASSAAITQAVQALSQTVNENFDFTTGLINSGSLSRLNVLNVKDSGAKGDGITDDTDAILKAMLDAGFARKILYFPKGIYIVRPGNEFNHRETQYMLMGDGNESIIKVKNGVGQYNFVFKFFNTKTVAMKDLYIDHNDRENLRPESEYYTNLEDGSGGKIDERIFISAYITQDFVLDNVKFYDSSSTNIFQVFSYTPNNNPARWVNVRVTNCDVLDYGLSAIGTGLAYDVSVFRTYTNEFSNVLFANNRIIGAQKGLGIAYNAIEVNSFNYVCRDNYIENFHFAFLTSTYGIQTNSTEYNEATANQKKFVNGFIYGNKGKNLRKGIYMWGLPFEISKVDIFDNIFYIDANLFTDTSYHGHYTPGEKVLGVGGITFYLNTRGFSDINIHNNAFVYEKSQYKLATAEIGSCGGISTDEREPRTGFFKNITIANNKIINPQGFAISLQAKSLDHIVIDNNDIVNPQYNSDTASAVVDAYSAISLRNLQNASDNIVKDVTIKHNDIMMDDILSGIKTTYAIQNQNINSIPSDIYMMQNRFTNKSARDIHHYLYMKDVSGFFVDEVTINNFIFETVKNISSTSSLFQIGNSARAFNPFLYYRDGSSDVNITTTSTSGRYQIANGMVTYFFEINFNPATISGLPTGKTVHISLPVKPLPITKHIFPIEANGSPTAFTSMYGNANGNDNRINLVRVRDSVSTDTSFTTEKLSGVTSLVGSVTYLSQYYNH